MLQSVGCRNLPCYVQIKSGATVLIGPTVLIGSGIVHEVSLEFKQIVPDGQPVAILVKTEKIPFISTQSK